MNDKRDLLTLADLGTKGLLELLDRSAWHQRHRRRSPSPGVLDGRAVAYVYDKPSTRTRVSIEVATVELGGHPVLLGTEGSQMGRGEPIEDTARVLDRMVSLVAFRTGPTSRLEALARSCKVPVLNALSDDAHPLQVLADLHAVRGARGTLDGLRVAWVGDASNVARSWMEAAGLLQFEMVLATPEGFGPPPAEVQAARARGGRVDVTRDPRAAARGADVLVTDVWVSMGQESEADARRQALSPYRVTRALVADAAPKAIVLHCLPAHRGEEIDADVIDGPHSYVWDAVEARLHTTKAAFEWALAPTPARPSTDVPQ